MTANHKITVHFNNKKYDTLAEYGMNLLKHLQEKHLQVVAPCGGLGSCGKCKVHISGEGDVLSCMKIIDNDLEIILPNQREMKILEAQHQFKASYPLNPGEIVSKSSCPMGVAVDIGTTTLVFYLINLNTGQIESTLSQLNPQTKYGADVISRISFSNENEHGRRILQNELVDVINQQLKIFAKKTGYELLSIVKMVFTGNTTMLHFLTGSDASTIGLAPYKAVFTDKQICSSVDLGIGCNPEAEILLMPSISAFVGADIVSGIASLSLPPTINNYLFVDIGTNGEMALVTPDKIVGCATAAGPAFEGANISCGMAAQEGAIDAFTHEGYTTIGNAKPSGICGSGLIDLIAVLLDRGIIDSEGIMEKDFVVAEPEQSANKEAIVLKPDDIREVQLAKSAIAAGLNVLVKQAGLEMKSIDALILAGGFGNYIRSESALRIGLFPKELSSKIIPVGNAAGTGAQMYLQSGNFETHVEAIRSRSTNIELFEIDDFVVEYVMQMQFPLE